MKAYVVFRRDTNPSNDLKRETAPYKYPQRVEFVDELPKTSSGKIRRTALRDRKRRNKAPDPLRH